MGIEKPYGNQHGKNEMAFPQLLQVFGRNRLIILSTILLSILLFIFHFQIVLSCFVSDQ